MNIGVQSTVGWIIRDDNGVHKGAAQASGKRIILENDCSKAIDILNGKTLHFSFYNWIREIKWWVMRFDE
ncbi:BnaCnng30780D, partial [Brassica napus]